MSNKKTGIFAPFVRPYEGSDIRLYKKARLLAPVSAAIGALAAALVVLMALTGALAVAGILAGLLVFCALTLVLMAKGRYEIASAVFLYALYGVMFAAIKFDQYQNVYEIYVFAALGGFLLVTAALVGARPSQAFIMAALNIVAIVALYALDALPLDGGQVSELAIQSLGTAAILQVAGGIFSAMAIRLQADLVAETVRSSTGSERQYRDMAEAVGSVQASALDLGKRLSDSAETLTRSAKTLRDTASEETAGIASLDEALVAAEAGQRVADAAQDSVKAALDEYSAKVLEASASIAQMVEALDGLGSQAQERREAVSALADLARDGDERVGPYRRGGRGPGLGDGQDGGDEHPRGRGGRADQHAGHERRHRGRSRRRRGQGLRGGSRGDTHALGDGGRGLRLHRGGALRDEEPRLGRLQGERRDERFLWAHVR